MGTPISEEQVERTDTTTTPPGATQPERASVSAGEFLAGYWGEQWPEIEKRMLESRMNLDLDYVFSPWEVAAPEIEKQSHLDEREIKLQVELCMHWPSDVSIESVNGVTPGLGLENEEELDEALAIATPFNDELRQFADTWVTSLDYYIRDKWARGDFLRAPFTTVGVKAKQDMGFYSAGLASHGWAVGLTLKHEDCPDMVTLMDEMNGVIERREAALLNWSRGRRAR